MKGEGDSKKCGENKRKRKEGTRKGRKEGGREKWRKERIKSAGLQCAEGASEVQVRNDTLNVEKRRHHDKSSKQMERR